MSGRPGTEAGASSSTLEQQVEHTLLTGEPPMNIASNSETEAPQQSWTQGNAGQDAGGSAAEAFMMGSGSSAASLPLQKHEPENGKQRKRTSGKAANPPDEQPIRLGSRHAARFVLLGIIAIFAGAVKARGGAVEWLLFGVSAAVGCFVWILPYAFVGRIELRRELGPAPLYDGGSMKVKLTVRTSRPMPFMWVAVTEELSYPFSSRKERVGASSVYMPWLGRNRSIRYTVDMLHRGEMVFGDAQVAVGDIFGMTIRTFKISSPARVTILPDAPPGERISTLPGAIVSITKDGAQAVSRSTGAALQFARTAIAQPGASTQTRSYIPGDPLRLVSWRAMARGLGMQTRVGSPEPPNDIVLLLDRSSRTYAGQERQFDAAVGRAALALRYAVRSGRGVTLLTGKGRHRVGAGDETALRQAEEELAQLPADLGGDLNWLAPELAKLPKGAEVICITADAKAPFELTGLSARARRVAAAKDKKQGQAPSEEAVRPKKRRESDEGQFDKQQIMALAAKLVQARGGAFYLWLGVDQGEAVRAKEASWNQALQGSGCRLFALPLPQGYMVKPFIHLEEGSAAHEYN